jgi:hypothetical protein
MILDRGALLCDRRVEATSLLAVEVGDRSIKGRRRRLDVTKPPGGNPCDYVPFYFAPRSPMLFRISRGGVEQYPDGDQTPLIYLTTSVDQIVSDRLPWLFSDGNCAADLTDYYDDLSELDSVIDWPLMRARYWADTADDPDRCRRRMAEFLVHDEFPVSSVSSLATKTQKMADTVTDLLREAGTNIPVNVRPDWYY